jgi:hypothetical protein
MQQHAHFDFDFVLQWWGKSETNFEAAVQWSVLVTQLVH